jgi:hypothetical protein
MDAARSGVYRATAAENLPDGVAIDLRKPVFDAFADALAFPAWFGRNWDALEDCLTERSGVLLIHHAAPGDELGVLVDVLRSVADYWREQGEPFIAVFVDPARRLQLPELSTRQ